jgi:hypothetical protein
MGEEAAMASTRRLAIGAVIVLGIAIVGVSVTGTLLVNRRERLLLETRAEVSDHQQLRRYFLQGSRDLLR